MQSAVPFVPQFSITLHWVDRGRDLLARSSAFVRAEPFRRELRDDIGEAAYAGQKEDDVRPWPKAAGLGRTDDQDDVQKKEQHTERQGDIPQLHPAQPRDA